MAIEPSRLTVHRRALALGVLCAAFFMTVVQSTSIFAALTSMGEELGLASTDLAWVITVYGVVIAGLMLPFGRVADVLGRRRVFLGAVTIFGSASLACGLASSGAVLISARAVQALGAAALTPSALALLLGLFPEGPGRNRALGIWGGLGGIGATAGLLFGGLVTDAIAWSWIFYANVPACGAILLLTPYIMREPPIRGRRRLDLPGGVLLSGTLMLLVFGLLEYSTAGWVPRTWVAMVGRLS